MSDQQTSIPGASDTLPVLRLATGFWISQALFVAAKLGIADQLAQGPRSAGQLAEAAGAHPEALRRVLRALAAAGLFTQEEEDRFALAPQSEPLRSDAPNTVRDYLLMFGSEWSWRGWGNLEHSVRTGHPAVEHALGKTLFEHFAEHPEDARIFDAAMASRSRMEDAVVAATCDLPAAGTIVDVGGGRGTQLATVLMRAPDCNGILFDLPHVVPAAAKVLKDAGLAARCEVVSGDFFKQVPAGGDLYLLKKVVHDWDDERARAILDNCRKAMAPKARVLLVEHVLIPGKELSWAVLLDLQMLVLTPGGRERSEAEYKTLLASAGLRLRRIISTVVGPCLIEASA